MSALDKLFHIARAAFIDIVGRFAIQTVGFLMMTAFMLGLVVPYRQWTRPGNQTGFVVMCALTFFFANFGPNATTFIVPAEIYPARLRATCHGISAASGKVGAIIGSFGFLYLAQSQDPAKTMHGYGSGIGVRNSLLLLAGCIFLGFLLTFLVPEPKGKSLEEMSRETEK
jgi:MFS transporter, PHS family, inorganic phosphate transporter